MEYVLVWVALGALVGAAIGKSKGRALAGAAWGIFLGPIGWIVMAIVPDVRIKCPFCGGEIVAGAIKCKNCGSDLPVSSGSNGENAVERYKQWKKSQGE
jgi:hypothetical protein